MDGGLQGGSQQDEVLGPSHGRAGAAQSSYRLQWETEKHKRGSWPGLRESRGSAGLSLCQDTPTGVVLGSTTGTSSD